MKPSRLKVPGPLAPHDERDSVFARARLSPGDGNYEEYYRENPRARSGDDRTRKLGPLAGPDSGKYEPKAAVLIEAMFAACDLVAHAVEHCETAGTPDGLSPLTGGDQLHSLDGTTPGKLTEFAKEAALFLGARDVGITELERGFVYSTRGRPTEAFGKEVELDHSFAVVLVFPMRAKYVSKAPAMMSTAETARVYQQAAAASFGLAGAFERLGISARAHVDSNYLVVCPPLAVRAGLGELGRNGILVHHRYGPGVRLGVVSVNTQLVPDGERCFGIADFCRTCAKCASHCPVGAIPKGDTVVVTGAEKWPMDPQKCYHYWRTQGTDCGVCIRSCPFAKPDTFLHRMVRGTINRTTLFNKAFLRFDDWMYGDGSQ